MSSLKTIYLAFLLVCSFSLSVFGQWSAVDSGTTSNLNGAYLLDSGTGFVAGDTGTILKSTDSGSTWAPLASGTTTTLHSLYFFSPNEGVAVGDSGTILRTTDGGGAWQNVTSGVGDGLRAVSFSGRTESVLAVRKRSFIRLTRELPGRSAKAVFLVLASWALRC
jgi:photosystem II stability/assembly factor-like uncharacterized protein